MAVDKKEMVEGVKKWYNVYDKALPLNDALDKWSEHFNVKKETVRDHLKECSELKSDTSSIYLRGE